MAETQGQFDGAVRYNHDLDVAPDFLDAFPTIRIALRDERLLTLFHHFDTEARRAKGAYHSIGVASLALGLIGLSGTAVSIMQGELLGNFLPVLGLGIEGASVASIILIILNRVKGYNHRWRLALFRRERLRQWHFQKFLDGQLISWLAQKPEEYSAELERRWAVVQQELRSNLGEMERFVRRAGGASELYHPLTRYADSEVEGQALTALRTLRLTHQLSHAGIKLDAPNEGAHLALNDHQLISDTIATSTLSGAILLGAVGFLFALGDVLSSLGFSIYQGAATTGPSLGWSLAGLSLLLAVWSAGARAYQTGYTVTEEKESYQEYVVRVGEIYTVFAQVSLQDKWRELAALEAEAVSELRRFLRIKGRASFVS